MALKVQPNEVDGWDVVREEDGVALTNHPSRADAEAAARLRAHEEHLDEGREEGVVVDDRHVHTIDDTRLGMRTAFLALGGLLLLVTLIATIAALTGALSGFGS